MSAKRSAPSPFVLEGKFSCSTFPEPLLNKFGWESCDNCSIQRRLQPNGSRKADNRSCMRSHGGGRKGLIRIKVCCGDTEEINQEAMVDCQEIIPFHKVECELGEMFAFNYERLVRFILKTSAFQPCKKQILIVNLAENIRFLVLENFPR